MKNLIKAVKPPPQWRFGVLFSLGVLVGLIFLILHLSKATSYLSDKPEKGFRENPASGRNREEENHYRLQAGNTVRCCLLLHNCCRRKPLWIYIGKSQKPEIQQAQSSSMLLY